MDSRAVSDVVAKARGASREFSRIFLLPLRLRRSEIIAVVLLCPILLSIAIWNGFPIIYYDTGAYVLEGVGHAFVVERSPVYSIFIFLAGGQLSLWIIALIQALLCAFVMTEMARAVAPRMLLWALLALGVLLVVATALPWFVGQIEPDCLTAVVILSAYLIAFHAKTLGRTRFWLLVVACGFCTAAHPSHLALTAGLALTVAVYRGIVWLAKSKAWPAADPIPVFGGLILGLALIIASNFSLTGDVFVTRAGPAFLFARFLQDGIVMKLLDDTCPPSGYRLCRYRDRLPCRADGWLWGRNSPFFELGRFAGTDEESERIIVDSLKRYPLLNLEAAAKDTWTQFFTFWTGDQIEPQEWALKPVFLRFIPAQVPAYMAARQQRGQIRFHNVNLVDVPFASFALAWLALMLVIAVGWKRRRSTVFLGYVVIALLGNAFICGALSNPHARYQARIMWIVPFALALAAADWRSAALRGVSESGLNGARWLPPS